MKYPVGAPYSGPIRGTFFRLQVNEKVEFSLVEVYEKVGKSTIAVCGGTQNGQQTHFTAVKKTRNLLGLVIYSYLKDGAFTAVN